MPTFRVQLPVLLFLMGVGTVLRVQVAREVTESPVGLLLENPSTDMKTFLDQSASILEDPWLRKEGAAFYQSPLYPYYLAVMRWMAGGETTVALRRQAWIDSSSIAATFLLGKVVHGPAVGLMAAGLVAIHGPAVLHGSMPLSVTLEMTLGTLFLALLLQCLFRDRKRDWLLAGIAAGLAALARPNFLVLLALIPVEIWRRGRTDAGVARPASHQDVLNVMRSRLALFALPLVLLHVPVVVRNYVVAGSFAVLPTSGSVNFKIGNSEDSTAGGFHYPERPPLSVVSPAFVKLNLRKLAAFYNTYEWPQNVNYMLAREYLSGLQLPLLELKVLLPLALAGALLVLWSGPIPARFLVLGLFLAGLSISLFFVVDRFRLPLVPGYAVLASLLLAGSAGWRKSWPFWVLAVCAIPLMYRPPERPIRYNDHGMLQDMARMQADWIAGVPIAEKFVRDFPEQPEVVAALGSHLMVLGKGQEGATYLEAALSMDPDHIPALRDLVIYYRDLLKQPGRAEPLIRRLEALEQTAPQAPPPR